MEPFRQKERRDLPANPQMTYEQFLLRNPGRGRLKVQATRAGGALPISQMRVLVYRFFDGIRVLFYDGRTDADGITPDIALPAPPRAGSLSPRDPQRGSIYQVYATHPDHRSEEYQVEIFEGITAILPVTLRPPKEG